jgi:hypothetical protein
MSAFAEIEEMSELTSSPSRLHSRSHRCCTFFLARFKSSEAPGPGTDPYRGGGTSWQGRMVRVERVCG